jgi:hypothetical protein
MSGNNIASNGTDSVEFGNGNEELAKDSATLGNDSAPVHCHSQARFYWLFH